MVNEQKNMTKSKEKNLSTHDNREFKITGSYCTRKKADLSWPLSRHTEYSRYICN